MGRFIYLLNSMLEIELLTHQEKISSVAWATVPEESTYTNIRYRLEFNIELHKRTWTLPQSMKVTLPIRFKKKKKQKFYKSGRRHAIKQLFWIFNWIHFKLKKPDQAYLTPALPSGDMKSILEHVGEEQLSVAQRDTC